MNPCWICSRPAVWRLTAERSGTPNVVCELYACEKCVPFAAPLHETGPKHSAAWGRMQGWQDAILEEAIEAKKK